MGEIVQVKASSVRMARSSMLRVSRELEGVADGPEKEGRKEFLTLQGVRLAFRIHQVPLLPPSPYNRHRFPLSLFYYSNEVPHGGCVGMPRETLPTATHLIYPAATCP